MDPVTLVDPNGAVYTTSDPVEFNNLVYGRGYRQVPDAQEADQSAVVDEADTADDRPAPPPRSGTGSGVDRWRQYAAHLGVEIGPDAGRDDVIEAIEAAGQPVE